MKNLSVICAAALALTVPGIAQAASPTGTHTFTGSIQVRKNLPVWTTCTLTLTVDVSGAGVATVTSAVLTGPAPCGGITFSGLPAGITLSGSTVTTTGVRIDIPPISIFPRDACEGPLKVTWGGNGPGVRTIVFTDGGQFGSANSNLPDADPDLALATENSCRITGAVVQNPGSLNLP